MSVQAAERAQHVRYGFPERFYDTDNGTTHLVKKRMVTWIEGGQKFGRWDYVPVGAPETDATQDSLL